MAINTIHSNKNYMGLSLVDLDPDEFSDTTIVGTCFAQEAEYNANASHNGSNGHVDTRIDVFPPGTHNVTFLRCNLDNVRVTGQPSTVGEGSTNRKIRVMNDAEDWELNENNNKPVRPVNVKSFEKYGLSIDPADIPEVREIVSVVKRGKANQ